MSRAPVPALAREAPTDGVQEPGLMAGIMRLHLLASAQLDAVTEAHGITLADYLVLGVVRRAPGGCSSPGAISDVLHRTSGGMTLTLDRLEAAGWVARSPDPTDRRKVTVTLTRAGLELAVRVNTALHEWERALELTPTRRRAALAGLDEISAALAETARTRP